MGTYPVFLNVWMYPGFIFLNSDPGRFLIRVKSGFVRNVDDIEGRGVKAVGPEQDNHHTDAQPPLPGLLRARQGGQNI